MTNLGTTSNIDTTGVCNPNPTPVPVPVPVPAPVAPIPVPVPTAPVPAPSVSTTAFTMTSINVYWSNYSDACNNGPSSSTQTYYHSGSGACPVGADYIYTDSAGTTLLSSVTSTFGKVWFIPSSVCSPNGKAVEISPGSGYIY